MGVRGWKLAVLSGAVCLAAGCIRDRLPDCPPLQVTLEVKDKNYFNIAEAERLGLSERRPEDLPFRSYVSSLYYILYDAAGNVVAEQSNAPVTHEGQVETIVFPQELPYGRYTLHVWGNMESEKPLDESGMSAVLEEEGAAAHDIYLAGAVLYYQYGMDRFTLPMERAKGCLLICAEGLPDGVDFSVKRISEIYSVVTSRFEYSRLTDVQTRLAWSGENEIVTQTLLCPSPGFEESQLEVEFHLEDGLLEPRPVKLTMGRNQLTILRYRYEGAGDDFGIYLYVDDHWEEVLGLGVEE